MGDTVPVGILLFPHGKNEISNFYQKIPILKPNSLRSHSMTYGKYKTIVLPLRANRSWRSIYLNLRIGTKPYSDPKSCQCPLSALRAPPRQVIVVGTRAAALRPPHHNQISLQMSTF